MDTLGKHILIELYEAPPPLLDQVNKVEEIMTGAARHIGAKIVHAVFHHFSPFGVSGVVVIEESHLAIHTWPEYGYAAIDLFTCGESVNPWQAYDFLKENFHSVHGSAMEMRRGQRSLLHPTGYQLSPTPDNEERAQRQVWFTQRERNLAFSLRQDSHLLLDKQSDYQKITVFESSAFGKVLTLENTIVITEGDERAYHEMLVHPALLHATSPERVLILGGGDGGSLREVLRHPGIRQVQLVERDPEVIRAVKAHFPDLATGFSDQRVQLSITEAMHFLRHYTGAPFDVILLDMEAEKLPDYTLLRRHLSEAGTLATQSHSPHLQPEILAQTGRQLHAVFGQKVRPYLSYIPTYPSGMWSFWLVSPAASPDKKREATLCTSHALGYLTPDVHRAAFALPAFVEKIVQKELDFAR